MIYNRKNTINLANYSDLQYPKHEIFLNIHSQFPASIYLLKVNNRNIRKSCEISSKLTIKTPDRRHWRRTGVFIVDFEHISHLYVLFSFLTLNKSMLARILPTIFWNNFFTKLVSKKMEMSNLIDYIRVDSNQQQPMKMKKSCTLPKVRSSIYVRKISKFIHNCHDHPSWTIKLQKQKFK